MLLNVQKAIQACMYSENTHDDPDAHEPNQPSNETA